MADDMTPDMSPTDMALEIHSLKAAGRSDEEIRQDHPELGPGWPYLEVVAADEAAETGAGPSRLTARVVPF